MKKRLVWLALVFMFVLAACGASGPSLEGLWKADFWDNSLIGFSVDDNVFQVYADSNKAYVLDYYAKGKFSLAEGEGTRCFVFTVNDESGNAVGGVAGMAEFVDENKIVITVDEACNTDGLELWEMDASETTLTLRRYKGG